MGFRCLLKLENYVISLKIGKKCPEAQLQVIHVLNLLKRVNV